MTNVSPFASPKKAILAGVAAFQAGDRPRAAEIFRSVAVQFPEKKNALAMAAEGLRTCGCWQEAVDLLENGLKQYPNSPAMLLGLAQAYVEANAYARAATYLQVRVERDPSDGVIWEYLGHVEFLAGNWAASESAYAKSLALQPLSRAAVLGWGNALYQVGRTEEALDAYRRANLLKPDDLDGLFKLGSLLVEVQQAEEAEALLRKVIALDPKHVDAHVNLARALHQRGAFEKALEVARRASKLNRISHPALSIFGALLLEGGQIAQAAEVLTRAVALVPTDVMNLMMLATAENSLGNTFAAERTLQRVLALEPGNLEARHMLAAVNGEPVRSVPPGYSRQLFNWYAPKFDRMLAGSLKYRAPEDATALLAETFPETRNYPRFLDLGCGTGLVADALAKSFTLGHKVGVDVAEKMIEVSRAKALYDELIHGDAADVLTARPESFDLITALDMFVYVGDLAGLLPLIAKALRPGGVLVYSIESVPEGKYKLRPTGRFAHSQAYVEELGRAAGFVPKAGRAVALRQEQSADVPGLIGILQR